MTTCSLRAIALAVVFLTVTLSNASAATVRFEGEVLVDNPVGSFDVLDGEIGTFFFDIDFSAADPDPGAFAGIIPNAVVGSGLSVGGQEWVDTTIRDLKIGFSNADGFAFIIDGFGGNSADFTNVSFGLISHFDPEFAIANPLITGNFGGSYLLLLTPGNVVDAVGIDDPVTGFFGATGVLGALDLQDPDPDPDPNPDPGQGQGGQPGVVPVPAALPLLISGLGALFVMGRRRRTV